MLLLIIKVQFTYINYLTKYSLIKHYNIALGTFLNFNI